MRARSSRVLLFVFSATSSGMVGFQNRGGVVPTALTGARVLVVCITAMVVARAHHVSCNVERDNRTMWAQERLSPRQSVPHMSRVLAIGRRRNTEPANHTLLRGVCCCLSADGDLNNESRDGQPNRAGLRVPLGWTPFVAQRRGCPKAGGWHFSKGRTTNPSCLCPSRGGVPSPGSATCSGYSHVTVPPFRGGMAVEGRDRTTPCRSGRGGRALPVRT